VTRAPQAIGSLAGDSSLKTARAGVTAWIPAFAGMTSEGKIKMGASFRWNDGGVVRR